MAQLNMVEVQAAVPAKLTKSQMSAPKPKAGSNSGSFSKHLQRLTRRSSENRDLPCSNKEAVAERPETSSNPLPVERKVENLSVARKVSASQKPAEQEAPRESAANLEVSAVSGEIQPEGGVQKAPDNIPLNEIPVIVAQETTMELTKTETVVQVSETADWGETGQNSGSADLFNELPRNTVQVALQPQENFVPPEEGPKVQVQVIAEELQQPTIPETGLVKQIAAAEIPKLSSLKQEAAVNNEAAANNMEPVKDGGAAPAKQVMDPKLLLAKQDSLKEPVPLVSNIPIQPDMAVDKEAEPVKVEEKVMNSRSEPPAPAAATVNESPAVVTAALTQSGTVSQPTNKRTDASNQGAKTAAIGGETVGDAETLLTQAVPDEKGAGSEPKQMDKGGESDKATQLAGNKESKARPGQTDLKFKAVAGMEAVKPKTEQAATDVKKLIAFESKRLKSDKGEVMQIKSEAAANSKPNEGETIALLAGKSGLEPEKNPLLRSATNLPTTDLPVEPEKVLEQIVKKAEMLVKLNSSEMKIQLHPEFLGKMTIKIMIEEGLLTAKFITDSHQVKQMLDSNLNTLRQSLEAQGIRVEKTEVNVQLNNGGMFDGSGQNPQESWQRHQFMSSQYPRSFNGQGYQTGAGALDDDEIAVNAIPEPDYGIGSNGTMNFLV